jgi:hypothetical protein
MCGRDDFGDDSRVRMMVDQVVRWLLLPLVAQVGRFAQQRSASARSLCSAISAFAALSTPEEKYNGYRNS